MKKKEMNTEQIKKEEKWCLSVLKWLEGYDVRLNSLIEMKKSDSKGDEVLEVISLEKLIKSKGKV